VSTDEPTTPDDGQPEPDPEAATGATIPLDPADAEPAPAAEPEVETSLTTKIALIEGEHFSVPYDMPVAEIRENLAATYPGIRTANVAKGRITIEGLHYETVEFSKQAGTKGLEGEADAPHPLLPLLHLDRVRAVQVPDFRNARLMRRGLLTFAEALDLPLFVDRSPSLSSVGVRLCQLLEDLPAAASGPALTVPGWSA